MREIKLKTLKFESGGCPTSYSGTTDKGESFYCRLRHGHMSIELNNRTIIDAYPIELDGVCGFEDFKYYANIDGWYINDYKAEQSSYIDDIEKALSKWRSR
jgi:hypothetical protein